MWTRFENTTKTRTNTAGGRAEQSTKAKVGAPTFKWFPRRLVIGLSTLPFTNHSSFPAICRSLLITIWSCDGAPSQPRSTRSEEHTSELQSRGQIVCRLLL